MLGSQDLGPEPPWLRTRVLWGLRTGFLSPTFPRTPLAQDLGPERGQSNWVLGSWVLSRALAQDPGAERAWEALLRDLCACQDLGPERGRFSCGAQDPGPERTWEALLRNWVLLVLSGPGRPRSWEAWVPVRVLKAWVPGTGSLDPPCSGPGS